MAVRDSVKALADLGFTNLEAEIYAFLLQESPATGYRIAQSIGKPAANTYKAIQTLEQKGAVIVEDGASRMCRAVSSTELLSRMGREFDLKRASAEKSLNDLNKPTADERIYQIRSRDQVFQKAREILAESQQVVLGLVMGISVENLAEDFLACAGRGVDLAIKSDQPIRIEGLEITHEEAANRPTPILHLVADGEQFLTASFDAQGSLTSAVWSRNLVLALTFHEGLAADMCLTNLAIRLEEGAGSKRITKTLASLRQTKDTSGYQNLKNQSR